MKINLVWGEGLQCGEDYLTINPFIDEESDNIKMGDVKNLDKWCDNGELDELLAYNIIDYLEPHKIVSTVDHWVGKLKHGGKIVISGVDAYDAARAFSQYRITLIQFNDLIHGESHRKPYLIKRANYTLLGLVEQLQQCGLTITKKRIDPETLEMIVEAIRP